MYSLCTKYVSLFHSILIFYFQSFFQVYNTLNNFAMFLFMGNKYSETLNNEYIERIHQMSYSSVSDNGMLQIFSFLIKWLYGAF